MKRSERIVTVKDGSIYLKQNKDDSEYKFKYGKDNISLLDFDVIKLQANESEIDEFSYWTLNGMIYSYDESFKYSVWTDSNFEAQYKATATQKVPVSYVSDEIDLVQTSSDKYKASFLTEYYVPSDVTVVERGILFSANKGKGNIETAANGILNNGTLIAPDNCRKLVATENNIVNNEVFMGFSNLGINKSYYFRAYIIYKENGQTKIVYSDYVAYVENVGEYAEKGLKKINL